MAKSKRRMHFPPDMRRQSFSFRIPPSDKETTINIEIEIYSGEGNAMVRMQPLLGDGLVPPDKIRWAGHEYDLTPLEWKLLEILLYTLEKRQEDEAVMDYLWPEGDGDEGKLKKQCSALNKRLVEMSFWGTVRRKGGWVILE